MLFGPRQLLLTELSNKLQGQVTPAAELKVSVVLTEIYKSNLQTMATK